MLQSENRLKMQWMNLDQMPCWAWKNSRRGGGRDGVRRATSHSDWSAMDLLWPLTSYFFTWEAPGGGGGGSLDSLSRVKSRKAGMESPCIRYSAGRFGLQSRWA